VGTPVITSVSPLAPQPVQRIVIKGSGFGTHPAYMNQNTPYLAIHDGTDDTATGGRNISRSTL
jgi:hypothetical protein